MTRYWMVHPPKLTYATCRLTAPSPRPTAIVHKAGYEDTARDTRRLKLRATVMGRYSTFGYAALSKWCFDTYQEKAENQKRGCATLFDQNHIEPPHLDRG